MPTGSHRYNGVRVDIELEFLKRGLDPNDGKLAGRFMEKEFHKLIHGNIKGAGKGKWGDKGGGDGPFNYQWWRFFQENQNATEVEILEFLNELVEKTSDFTVKKIEDIDWRYWPD